MISKIKQEFIERMDKQENFFKTMQEVENRSGFQNVAAWLATSKEIEKQYMDYKNKNQSVNLYKDIFNIAFHHSLDRVITRQEHTELIIRAYEDYKKKGSWRKRKDVLKKLVKASNRIGVKS